MRNTTVIKDAYFSNSGIHSSRSKILVSIFFMSLLSSCAFANLGEVSGNLNYNFNSLNQSIIQTWTLVNTGNTTLNITISNPSNANFTVSIPRKELLLAPQSYNPINVTITLHKPVNTTKLLIATVEGSSNVQIGIAKKLQIHSSVPKTTSSSSNFTLLGIGIAAICVLGGASGTILLLKKRRTK